ncbi:UDP-N-acetylglucosamine 2-epimerase (non-hydrolyzing) [Candidatus Sumerlaeota bacterium]|nr:UDP-N-acetylglucosamine 2-epimerase (non-hydrolyzing) [Candidatus Sumerlaeota bacterium]
MKILTVVGARPQFIKAAMVSRAVARHNAAALPTAPPVVEEIVHTGQHYDHGMSQAFFDEMEIPGPAVNLGVGSGTHGETTAAMLRGLEAEIVARRPDWVLVYGDTNSTLAGALAAAKLHVPVAHVEAGLRSFNKRMPEEINRLVADHVSTLLFCPTRAAVENLASEGIADGVHAVGDVMYDAALAFGDLARQHSDVLDRLGLAPKGYALATCHRAENTDSGERLAAILDGLGRVAESVPVVLPLHPRTRERIERFGFAKRAERLRTVEPVSFLDMIRLEQEARAILTDSGGVQKEAYFHGVPCVTLRDETEWVETVEAGWNTLAGADADAIAQAARDASPGRPIADYGDGHAADKILSILLCPSSNPEEET